MKRRVRVAAESFPLAGDFVIARGRRTMAEVVTVEIEEDGAIGRGEGTPIIRYGETQASAVAAVEAIRQSLEAGLDRAGLAAAMPAGAARNAVDCALWDLEAKQAGTTVWDLCGIAPPPSILTAYTLSLDVPEAMADAARRHSARPLLKLKLGGDGLDLARIAKVRDALPAARLIVDANEAVAPGDLQRLLDAAAELAVELVEQPLPAGHDAALSTVRRTVPVAADEACHTSADLAGLEGRYDAINVKLDKAGGLTEALALDARARDAGFTIMVGCMVSTSLGLAPAQPIAAGAAFVDLDSPLYLAHDRDHAIAYHGSQMAIAKPALWG